MENFKFHPSARERFDQLAASLLKRVSSIDCGDLRDSKSHVMQHVEPDHSPTSEQIVQVGPQVVDDPDTGRIIRVFWTRGTESFGLREADSEALRALAEKVHTGPLRDLVTRRFLFDAIVEWLQEQHAGEGTPVTACDFIEARVAEAVGEFELWVPIAELFIDGALPFGRASVQPITRAKFESWLTNPAINSLRHSIQGRAAVVVRCAGDPHHAMRRGFEVADQIVALLRVTHPVNSSPLTALGARPFGLAHVDAMNAFAERDGRGNYLAAALEPMPEPIRIALHKCPPEVKERLDELADLYGEATKSPFQDVLLNALLIYSRNNLARDPTEKLLFVLVALETMLLKNASEPIQQNVAERLAFFIRDAPAERIEVRDAFIAAYSVRSRFAHHGSRLDDASEIQPLMQYAWEFFLWAVRHHRQFESREALLTELESRKFS